MRYANVVLETVDDSPISHSAIDCAIIGGWTSRDKEAVEAHIRELAELGVPRPSETPCFYRISASRVTTASTIEVLGHDSSGEVEFVLLNRCGVLWVGVASDHTDRKVESYDVAVSKQMCDKPLAPCLWRLADVEPHWEQLTMRSYIYKDGARTLYQEGGAGEILKPHDLIEHFEFSSHSRLPDNCILFGGTFAAIGGVTPSPSFEFELIDPVLDRVICHKYDIVVI